MSVSASPHVLIVDDIEENLIALEALLKRMNVVPVSAHSGREALEHLLVHDFALALVDVNMPEMDGVQLAELMRGTQRTRGVPIIFVTAAYEPRRVFEGYDAGAIDFLIKPVEPRILQHKIRTFISLWENRRQLAEELAAREQLTAQLAESLRLHETFVAALNHDLRTPLHAISLGLQLLESDLEDPGQREVLARVASASERMTGMLDQLYDVARARLGNGISIEQASGDFEAVLRTAVREVELEPTAQPIEIVVAGDTKGTWDLSRLSRIATNLITNALKHGDKSTRVTAELDGRAAGEVRFAVRNAGVIAPELLPVIFEPFRRGSHSSEGLGLGLFIVREIARAHGGDVTVRSNATDGTTFEVRLPRHAAQVVAA